MTMTWDEICKRAQANPGPALSSGLVPRWVPVSERKPEPYKPVLIHHNFQGCFIDSPVAVGYYDPDANEWLSVTFGCRIYMSPTGCNCLNRRRRLTDELPIL